MLGGLVLWAVHFSGVYLLASLADIATTPDGSVWHGSLAAFSFACLAGTVVLGRSAFARGRRAPDDVSRFAADLGLSSAGLAAVAIVWQTLPAFLG